VLDEYCIISKWLKFGLRALVPNMFAVGAVQCVSRSEILLVALAYGINSVSQVFQTENVKW